MFDAIGPALQFSRFPLNVRNWITSFAIFSVQYGWWKWKIGRRLLSVPQFTKRCKPFIFLSMYVDVLKDACEAKNQNMCYQCVLHMTYFCLSQDLTYFFPSLGSTEEITNAYRRLSRIYHPDKHTDPLRNRRRLGRSTLRIYRRRPCGLSLSCKFTAGGKAWISSVVQM